MQDDSPWWHHGMVWLVISGPAAVIVAGFATLAIAIAYPDPVLSTSSATPAVQARNHANSGFLRAPPASPEGGFGRLQRPGAGPTPK
jgi:uncharacterized protein